MSDDEAREVEHEFYYSIPPHGWTCFHCGDTFTTPGAARDHFGFDPSADPACRIKIGEERGLVMELRRVEAKYVKLLEDSWEGGGTIAQEFYGLGAKHQIEMRKAEEEGYRKGLRDGRKERPVIEGGSITLTIPGEPAQPIETAPKDGTRILAFVVHPNADLADNVGGERSDWEGWVVAHWIEHNGGGWTWHGHMGTFTHWASLPGDPKP